MSNLFPAPQYSEELPAQSILQPDNPSGASTAAFWIELPQSEVAILVRSMGMIGNDR
jgi:hypothetical protein